MLRNKQQSGLSLIEVMVVVAILAILATTGLPAYRTWIQNTKIRTAAESIQNGISKARAEALARNTPVRFRLVGANSAWTVQCVTTAQCPDLTGGVVESKSSTDSSSNAITVTPTPGGATDVVFSNLGVKSAAGTLTQVDVDNSSIPNADSRDLSVTIGTGGNVRTCDPNAASTDPRKC